jgi:hypothetical protein
MADTASNGSRTKHTDTSIHFVRDLLLTGEDKIMDNEFVRSEENESVTLFTHFGN